MINLKKLSSELTTMLGEFAIAGDITRARTCLDSAMVIGGLQEFIERAEVRLKELNKPVKFDEDADKMQFARHEELEEVLNDLKEILE